MMTWTYAFATLLLFFLTCWGLAQWPPWIRFWNGILVEEPCPKSDLNEPCDLRPDHARIERWGSVSWHKYRLIVPCRHCGSRYSRIVGERDLKEHGLDPNDAESTLY